MKFEDDMRRALGASPALLLRLRMAGCGCRQGAVYRAHGRLVLVGSVTIPSTQDMVSPEFIPVLIEDIENASQPAGYGCAHRVGSLLPLSEIADHARRTTRRGVSFLLP